MTTTDLDPSFEELLEFVRDSRGFDHRAYERPTLMRRFAKRMRATGAETYSDYRDYLEAEPREFGELFDTILIDRTGFFRDPPAWDYLSTEVLPPLLEGKTKDQAIHVWSAGCSSGEEAYTAGMLLASALGENEYRRRVKIYATDVDEAALGEGRHGRYGAEALEAVPEELRARYFRAADGDFAISGDLRRSVIFGRNDLLSDPPISGVDLLLSRNTLVYFSPEAQTRVLSNFFFALNRNGYVFFGQAESFQARTNLFQVLDQRQRIFVKNQAAVPEPHAALSYAEALREELERAKRDLETAYEELHSTVEELERTNEALQSTNEELETTNEALRSTNEELNSTNDALETINDELRDRTDEAMGANAFLRAILASVHQSVVALDRDLRVLAWSDAAAELWGLRAHEAVGRHFLDLDVGLPVASLGPAIRQTFVTDAPHDVKVEARNRRGQPVLCTVSFTRLTSPAGEIRGVILVMSVERRDEPA